MNAKTTRIVTYIPVVGFILALTIGDYKDEETKMHVNQSIVISIVLFASSLLGVLFGIIPIFGILFRILFGLLSLGLSILAVLGIIFCAMDQKFEIPVVSQIRVIR